MSTNDINNRIVFSREQFQKSIDKAIKKAGVNRSQATQFSEHANSIFSSYDTVGQDGVNGADGNWNQTEAQNGAAALTNFYQIVNDAINGVNTKEQTDDLLRINAETVRFNNMDKVSQDAEILADFQAILKNAESVSVEGDTVNIIFTEDGKTYSLPINLDELNLTETAKANVIGLLKQANQKPDVSESEGVTLDNQVIEYLNNLGITSDKMAEITSNVNSIVNTHSEKGFQLVGQHGFLHVGEETGNKTNIIMLKFKNPETGEENIVFCHAETGKELEQPTEG